MADTAIALESFAGSPKETNPIFKDYHGLLHIKKMAAINTLAAFNPKTYDLAFKMRRKKFVIEVNKHKIHNKLILICKIFFILIFFKFPKFLINYFFSDTSFTARIRRNNAT